MPPGDDGREERSEGGEAEAGAVHRLDAEALRQTPAEDLWGWTVMISYTQFTASGTGLVGRYQNFEKLLGTVDIKFLREMGQ